MKQPELIVKSSPIDLELCELLGDKPCDFLVICFDGVQFEDFGTPYDTPLNRRGRQGLVDLLNDHSDKSLWPKMFSEWAVSIRKQFQLPESATAENYHPVVSYNISRVCPGYSENLHCAIRLFEMLADKIEKWTVCHDGPCRVEITSKSGAMFVRAGDRMSLVIAETVRELLSNPPRPEPPDGR